MWNMEDMKQNDLKLSIVIKWSCTIAIVKYENSHLAFYKNGIASRKSEIVNNYIIWFMFL